MNDRPTPETDSFFRSFADGEATPSHAEYYDRMIQLERERNDLLDRLTKLEHSMPEELARLERERDEAREQWRISSACRIFREQRDEARKLLEAESRDSAAIAERLFAVTEQRDRLAEVLRDILADMPAIANSGWACIKRAKAALAAVEGGEP